MIHYSCGCVNRVDADSGVLRCHYKCGTHRDVLAAQPSGIAYYHMLGAVDADGAPRCDLYVGELTEALGPVPPAPNGRRSIALEVGCGASPYVRALTSAGYQYVGVEVDTWAADWVTETYGGLPVAVITGHFPLRLAFQADFVLCAHVLEHLEDAPGALEALFLATAPGGTLWLVVPDDGDPVNPDHRWFFTEESLVRLLRRAGFSAVRTAVRRRHERESFIYCAAERAGA